MRLQNHIWRSLALLTMASALCIGGCQGGTPTATTGATTASTSTSSMPGRPTGTPRPTATATPVPTATLAPEPSPSVPTGHLLYTTGGNLFAVDISRQLLAWADYNNHGDQYYATPRSCQGQIIALAAPTTPMLQSLNPQNGAILWSAHIPLGTLVGCDSNHLYTASMTNLTAFDYTTGAKAWEVVGANAVVAISNGTVFASMGGVGLVALNAATGAQRWVKFPTTDALYYPLAASPTTVFVEPDDNTVHALATSDGHEIWKVAIPQAASLKYADGILYVSSDSDNLLALSATDGHQLWQLPTHAHNPGLPTVVNGVDYLTASDTHFYAVNEQTGAVLWKLTAPTNFSYLGQPEFDHNVLFYAQGDLMYGNGPIQFIGIDPQTQAVVWAYSITGYVGQIAIFNT
jgi:hypothetical protein